MRHRRGRKLLVRSLVLVSCMAIAAAGLDALHHHRKQRSLQDALANGLKAYEAGHYGMAADHLARYLRADANDVRALVTCGQAQIRRRPQTEAHLRYAVWAFEAALRIQPHNAEASRALCNLLLKVNALTEAETAARAWVSADPDELEAVQSLTAVLIRAGKRDEAMAVLEKACGAHRDRLDLAIALATMKAQPTGDNSAAASQMLNDVMQIEPQTASARLARAKVFIASGDRIRAADELRVAAQSPPEDLHGLLDLGQCCLSLDLYEQACIAFAAAELRSPADPEPFLAHAQAALEFRDIEGGATLAGCCLSHPFGDQRLDILPVCVELFAAAGRISQAQTCLDELRGAWPSFQAITYLQGVVYLEAGNRYAALKTLRQSATELPHSPRVHLALAQTYRQMGRLQHAADCLESFLRAHGDSPALAAMHLELADTYALMGRHADAADAASKAETIVPWSMRTVYASIEAQARALRSGGLRWDNRQMMPIYNRLGILISRDTRSWRGQLTLARMNGWLNMWPQAEAALDSAQKAGADGADLARTRIQMYLDAGRDQQAVAACCHAINDFHDHHRLEFQVRLAELWAARGNYVGFNKSVDDILVGDEPVHDSSHLLRLLPLVEKNGYPGCFERMLALAWRQEPHSIKVCLALIDAPIRPESVPGSEQLVDELKSLEGPDGLNWRIWQARLVFTATDWASHTQRIEQLLQECLARDCGNPEALATLTQLYFKTGRTPLALDVYGRALAEDPLAASMLGPAFITVATAAHRWTEVDRVLEMLPAEDPRLQNNRTLRMIRENRLDAAESLLNQRLAMKPDDTSAIPQLCLIARLRQKTEQITELLDKASSPDDGKWLQARVQWELEAGRPARALEMCNRALEQWPLPETRFLRAHVQDCAGQLPAAEADLMELASMPACTERAYLELGKVYARRGRLNEAVDKWREGLSAVQGSPLLRQAMLEALLEGDARQEGAGRELLDLMLAQMPHHEALLITKAQMLMRDQRDEAEALCQEIVARNAACSEASLCLIHLASVRNRPNLALDLVDRALTANPDNPSLLLVKYELLAGNDLETAQLLARRAVELSRFAVALDPEDEQAQVTFAKALAAAGDIPNATFALQRFMSGRDPIRFMEAGITLSKLLLAGQDAGAADHIIAGFDRQRANDPRLLQVKALRYAAQHRWQGLFALVQACERLDQSEPGVFLALAEVLHQVAMPEARATELRLLEGAVVRWPRSCEALNALGRFHYEGGHIPEAKAAFDRAIKIDASDANAVNNLAWILCEHENKPQVAERLIQSFHKRCPEDPSAALLDTMGLVQYRLALSGGLSTHLHNAESLFRQCLYANDGSESDRANAMFHLARLLVESNPDESRTLLKKLSASSGQSAFLSVSDQAEAAELLRKLDLRPTATSQSAL